MGVNSTNNVSCAVQNLSEAFMETIPNRPDFPNSGYLEG